MTLVPYITCREGEEAAALSSLRTVMGPDRRHRLAYRDQELDDFGPRGELWGRCSQQIGRDGMPVGRPLWSEVHPARQRETMMTFRCQVCVGPAKLPDGGYLFLTRTIPENGGPLLTAQPPVCLAHARAAVAQCPHLASQGHHALVVRSAPLYGVIGTPHIYGATGWRPLPGDDVPVPYGSDDVLRAFLASQLVRRLRDYTVVSLDDLSQDAPDTAAAMAS